MAYAFPFSTLEEEASGSLPVQGNIVILCLKIKHSDTLSKSNQSKTPFFRITSAILLQTIDPKSSYYCSETLINAFFKTGFLCTGPSCPETCFADHAGFEFTDSPLSTS